MPVSCSKPTRMPLRDKQWQLFLSNRELPKAI